MITALPPLAIVLGIIFSLAVLGAVIALVYNLHKFSGFQQLGRDAEKIASALHGELFRDEGDLVVSGNFNRCPVVVRFSNKQEVPALNIRIGVPANFTLWIAPRASESDEGRAILRTGNAAFDSRCSIRSDDPGQARLFVSLASVPRALHQLASSSETFVAFSPGSLEISELNLTADAIARHVLARLQLIATLIEALRQMPGADTIKVQPLRKEKRILARVAIVVGTVATLVVVMAATRRGAPKPGLLEAPAGIVASGILPVHATQIVALDGWRVATAGDFDPDAVAWLRDMGVPVRGRILGDFSGHGTSQDGAYVLVRSDGMRRIVLLVDGQNRFDVRYPRIALVARIPKSSLGNMQWLGSPPADIDGDGLLIVREAANPASAMVLFSCRHRIVTAVPQNYQALSPQ